MADRNGSASVSTNNTDMTDEDPCKVFEKDVQSAFRASSLYMDKTFTICLQEGHSAQFPAIFKSEAHYHAPGMPLPDPQVVKWVPISVDQPFVARHFIKNIDDLKKIHFCSHYAALIGEALARRFDMNIASCIYKAAEGNSVIKGGAKGDSVIKGGANVRTDPDSFKKAMFDAAQILDEKNVPQSDRYAFVPPSIFYMAVQPSDLITKDWDGDGSLSKGVIGELAGIKIVKSNNTLAGVNYDDKNTFAKYHGDYTDYAFQVFSPMAVGTVLRELDEKKKYIEGKYRAGHDVLCPECAIAVKAVDA